MMADYNLQVQRGEVLETLRSEFDEWVKAQSEEG
jgi:hypothetical protein